MRSSDLNRERIQQIKRGISSGISTVGKGLRAANEHYKSFERKAQADRMDKFNKVKKFVTGE